MSTIVLTLVILLGVIAGILFVVMFTPVIVTASVTTSAKERNLAVLMHCLHPSIVRWKYDVECGVSELMVLGLSRVFIDKKDNKKKENVPGNDKKKTPEASPVGQLTYTAPHRTVVNRQEKPQKDRLVAEEKINGQKKGAWRAIKLFLRILGDDTNQRAAVKTLRWCWRTLCLCFTFVGFHRIRLHVKAGAGDPAETGKLYGYYTAFDSACIGVHRNIDVRFTPDFIEDIIECDGNISLKTSCARIVLPFLVALVTFPYLTAYFVWRRYKKTILQDI